MCMTIWSNNYSFGFLYLALRGFILTCYSLFFLFMALIYLLRWNRKERLLDLSTTPQCHNGFDLFVVPLICINFMHFPRVLLGLK